MIIDRFNYTVTASIKFSKDELAFLTEAAKGHYDSKVRSLAGLACYINDKHEYKINGVLTIMELFKDEARETSTHELDLMLKALEQAPETPMRHHLREALANALLDCQSRWKRLNNAD